MDEAQDEPTPLIFWQHRRTYPLPDAPELQDGSATIRPEPAAAPKARLPTLGLRRRGAAEPDLEMLGALGQGGMAVVHLAEQIPLARHVAVKSLKEKSARAAGQLVREARITGQLEHPNVVPVYTLGQNPDGVPLLVMKRVEGRSWRQVLQADRATERLFSEAVLRKHLEILIQVCHAVSFAHSKGIVHRDLKPDNVMVGSFGEVYLLDWGIAVSTVADPGLGGKGDRLAGTPAYMAPEMVLGDLKRIGPRTDVYLLGAILHELIVGQRRHTGSSLKEIMSSVARGEAYQYSTDAPAELIATCRRATAYLPSERFDTAAAVREALESYLQHAASRALAREAENRLRMLEEGGDSARVHKLFAECRFAFRLALKEWPENPEARAGSRRALIAMAELEVARGALESAEQVCSELAELPPPLAASLEALRTRRAAEQHELEGLKQLAFDSDLEVSKRWRAMLALVLAVGFAVIPMIAAWGLSAGWLEEPTWQILAMPVAACVFIALAAWWKRRIVLVNNVNRRLVGCLIAAFGSLFLHRLIALWHGVPLQQALGQETAVLFAATVTAAVCLDRRLAWAAACFFLSGLVIAVWPAASLPGLGVGAGAALFSVWRVWR